MKVDLSRIEVRPQTPFTLNPPMKSRQISLIAGILTASFFSLMGSSNSSAGKFGCITPGCHCTSSTKTVEVEKTGFEIENTTLVIPKVVFPWQVGGGCFGLGLFGLEPSHCDASDACDSSISNGSFEKQVKVLSKKKYTVPVTHRVRCEKKYGECDEGCDSAHAWTIPHSPDAAIADREVEMPLINIAPVRVR